MKWLRRILIAIAILAVGLVATAYFTALRTDNPVAFQLTRATGAAGQSFPIGVWYPTTVRPRPTTLIGPLLLNVAPDGPVAGSGLPLVVISHGNGGGPGSHADLALALADAGYVVAAPLHPGESDADPRAIASATFFNERTRQFRATIDHMLVDWPGHEHIDPERIGAFGFSAGGFTVLTAVGAQPDLSIIARHCADTPEFICEVLRHAGSPLLKSDTSGSADTSDTEDDFLPDPRIKAAVVAAPGLGFTMSPRALENVRVPVQLWSAEQDSRVPYATNAGLVRAALGSRAEFHSVTGAGHLSFLAPCGLLAPPALCADEGGFDRRAFHDEMNAGVVAFFAQKLPKPEPGI